MLTFAPIVGVAEIREVHRLRPGAEHGLLQLDEIADLRALARTSRPARRCANGPTRRVVARSSSPVITQWLRTVTRSPIRESTIRAPLWISQPAADRRAPFERHAGMDDRVRRRSSTSRSMYVVAGSSIVTPAAISCVVFCVSHDSAHCRQLDAAVDAANLVGIRDGDRFDRRPALPVDRDEIRQVVLAAARSRRRCSARASNSPSSANA